MLELEEAVGGGLGGLGLAPDLLELRAHQTAEVGQMGEVALAPEQEPAELVLELLDRARQGRLGHVAVLGRAGEVQGLADREEVADLVHLHHGPSRPAGRSCPDSIKLIHSRHLLYRQPRDQIVISLPPELAAGPSAGRPFPGGEASTVEVLAMLRSIVVGVVALIGWAPAQGSEPAAAYELTIRNTNPGQNFSPPVILMHRPEYRLFEPGQPASESRSGASPRTARRRSSRRWPTLPCARSSSARRSIAATPRSSPPRSRRRPYLLISVAAMLSLTNDGFVAARSVGLPEEVGASIDRRAARLRRRLRGQHRILRACALRGP